MNKSIRKFLGNNYKNKVPQTAVTAEDFLVNDGGDRQTVETVGERLP